MLDCVAIIHLSLLMQVQYFLGVFIIACHSCSCYVEIMSVLKVVVI